MTQASQRKLLCIGPRACFAGITRLLREPLLIVHELTLDGALAVQREYDAFTMIAVASEILRDHGTACIETLKRQAPDTHVVIMSSRADAADQVEPTDEPALAVELGGPRAAKHLLADPFNHSVLVVDDDPSIVQLIAKTLTDAGYRVITASNGLQAMRLLLDEGAQIVVADWLMPEMDGVELCRAIRSNESIGFVYYMVVTAITEKKRILEAFEAGADDFITKPFDQQELLVRMHAGSRVVALEADLMRRNREIHKANAEMAILNNKLQSLATRDELTGLINRRHALDKFRHLWSIAERYSIPISCVALDLDHFKSINDTHGHAAGDAVLRSVARELAAAARTIDVVSRIGGEEFLVITPNTDAQGAAVLSERIRTAIEKSGVRWGDSDLKLTASMGIAERDVRMTDPESLIRIADAALYSAKQKGRNRVCIAESDDADRPRPAERPVSETQRPAATSTSRAASKTAV